MTLVRRPSPFSKFVTPCRAMDHLSAPRREASVVEVGAMAAARAMPAAGAMPATDPARA